MTFADALVTELELLLEELSFGITAEKLNRIRTVANEIAGLGLMTQEDLKIAIDFTRRMEEVIEYSGERSA